MLKNPFGFTRSVVARDHALITPDSHVFAPLSGWENTLGVIHISPRMGSADFAMYRADLRSESRSKPADLDIERFVYVLSGNAVIGQSDLSTGGYAYLPPNDDTTIAGAPEAVLLVFERKYIARVGFDAPAAVISNEKQIEGLPFMGDDDARLKTLLPSNDPSFDMAVNIFTYQPGATLPNVEVHIMEHGLMMIGGAGVYRLSESYYPVQEGDVIWMAPYCPQWFVAMGKVPARYIYYKDMHRDPLGDSQ